MSVGIVFIYSHMLTTISASRDGTAGWYVSLSVNTSLISPNPLPKKVNQVYFAIYTFKGFT